MTTTALTSGLIYEDPDFVAQDYTAFVLTVPDDMDDTAKEETVKDNGGTSIPVLTYKPEFVRYAWETFGDLYKSVPKGERFEIYPGLFIDYVGMSYNAAGRVVKGTRSSTQTLAYRRRAEIRKAEEALNGSLLVGQKSKYDVRDYVAAMRASIPPAVYAVDLRDAYDKAVEDGDWKAIISIGKAMGLHFKALDMVKIDAPDEVVSLEAMIRRKNAELKRMRLDKKIADNAKTLQQYAIDLDAAGFTDGDDEVYDEDYESE